MYPVVFKLAVSAAFGMECKTHCYLTFTVLLLVYMNGWMVYFIEQHFSSSKDINKGSIEALFLSVWRIQVVLIAVMQILPGHMILVTEFYHVSGV